MAQHATRKCKTANKKKGMLEWECPNRACKINTIKQRTDQLPLVTVVK